MESYERWFRGKPELDILHVMGLFDRPADAGAVAALRKKPPIAGLTTALLGLSDADWGFALANLRDAKLLAAEDPAEPDTLDAHPLVREHFGEQLRREVPDAWREAHSRLFEHYKSAAKELPDTVEEMAPLYAAVAHGCQAGRHQEALGEVYLRRIRRGKEAFSIKKLGAFGADLAALSGFFDPPWRRPVDGLTETDRSWVSSHAGFYLRALGRPADGVEPMRAGLMASVASEDWQNAAIRTGNLSELSLGAGDVAGAVRYAAQSVELADRSGDAFQRIVNRSALADTLHQAGDVEKAGAAFREAEAMQAERQPEFPLLYSLQGYRDCDLLLGGGLYTEVQRRAVGLWNGQRSTSARVWGLLILAWITSPWGGRTSARRSRPQVAQWIAPERPRRGRRSSSPRPRRIWTRRWRACGGPVTRLLTPRPAGPRGVAPRERRPRSRPRRPGRSAVHRDARGHAAARGGLSPGVRPAVPGGRRDGRGPRSPGPGEGAGRGDGLSPAGWGGGGVGAGGRGRGSGGRGQGSGGRGQGSGGRGQGSGIRRQIAVGSGERKRRDRFVAPFDLRTRATARVAPTAFPRGRRTCPARRGATRGRCSR